MPKNKKRRTFSSSNNNNTNSATVKKLIFSGTISSILFFILMILLAFITMKATVSDSMQNILVFLFAAASPLTGAFLTFKKENTKGIILGASSAAVCIIITCIVLISILHTLGLKTLLMSALMLIGGISGGILAVNK